MNDIPMVPDEKTLIEQALRGMRSKEPGVPEEKVQSFLARVGEMVERNGTVSRADVDELLRQLKSGGM